MKLTPFHLAIPVKEITTTRAFYRDTLGCKEGRSSDHWVDFDFFGHQLVIHVTEEAQKAAINAVDGKAVPVPHFGVVLEWDIFDAFAKAVKEKGIKFIIEPYIRFEGLPGEQATMFFQDPSGNSLEFKSFKDFDQIFAS
ncbi:VOC family protein [uncultured Nonlabens sp.]|uniref:VOC family protein n=1 Tax=uncultured Nonlabens sp. TaxID=859306 RepID=UPI00260D9F7D|nr:VOC family protein [uncultured Nonlabens sp.]